MLFKGSLVSDNLNCFSQKVKGKQCDQELAQSASRFCPRNQNGKQSKLQIDLTKFKTAMLLLEYLCCGSIGHF